MDDELLKCPQCGSEFSHQIGYEVFERAREDDEHGTYVSVGQRRVSITSDYPMDANPSRRRSGLVVHLICENDDHPFDLTVVQHKGQTFLSTRECMGHKTSTD